MAKKYVAKAKKTSGVGKRGSKRSLASKRSGSKRASGRGVTGGGR